MTIPSQEVRMPRLLSLVPYFLANPGIAATEAAAELGITEAQLRKDLELLIMCGSDAGHYVDLTWDSTHITVSEDAELTRPVRLSAKEGIALTVALRALAESPGLNDNDVIARTLAKIETATGGAVDAAVVPVAVNLDEDVRFVPLLTRAVEQRRALRITYLTAARDESSDRVVDPVRVFSAGGSDYLQAWCRQAEGLRVFRADRISAAELLAEPARPPADLEVPEIVDGLYQASPEDLAVTLRLGPGHAWIADYYATESVAPDGEDLIATLRVSEQTLVQGWVLGSGGEVTVLSPSWLADAIKAEAAAALALYP